jgi:hypothetical protein
LPAGSLGWVDGGDRNVRPGDGYRCYGHGDGDGDCRQDIGGGLGLGIPRCGRGIDAATRQPC